MKKSSFQYGMKFSVENGFFHSEPLSGRRKTGPGIVFSGENEISNRECKFQARMRNFMCGGNGFFMRSRENDFFRSPGPLGNLRIGFGRRASGLFLRAQSKHESRGGGVSVRETLKSSNSGGAVRFVQNTSDFLRLFSLKFRPERSPPFETRCLAHKEQKRMEEDRESKTHPLSTIAHVCSPPLLPEALGRPLHMLGHFQPIQARPLRLGPGQNLPTRKIQGSSKVSEK